MAHQSNAAVPARVNRPFLGRDPVTGLYTVLDWPALECETAVGPCRPIVQRDAQTGNIRVEYSGPSVGQELEAAGTIDRPPQRSAERPASTVSDGDTALERLPYPYRTPGLGVVEVSAEHRARRARLLADVRQLDCPSTATMTPAQDRTTLFGYGFQARPRSRSPKELL